ncbi:HNH endonuclease signature motif containing protein [Streptomyces goshikiensis]|uniref:HNH endonuclease signature motif containing protein n=1 Tax=Streptomyces goshikiensis TaxID=1942 RepID=UPI0037245CEB
MSEIPRRVREHPRGAADCIGVDLNKSSTTRFWVKVNKDGPAPSHSPELGCCWLWKLPGGVGGYGSFYLDGRMQTSHRVAYQLEVGDIPQGLVVDHLCRVRNCVRPSHLEPVTPAENNRRGRVWESGAAAQRAKTHCPYGHPYSGENLRICKDGKRACRACDRRYSSEFKARKKALNPPQPRPPRTTCKKGHEYATVGRTTNGGCKECAREAMRRSRARAKAKRPPKLPDTHCRHGHEWNAENTYVSPGGLTACRACHRDKSREWYRARAVERRALTA